MAAGDRTKVITIKVQRTLNDPNGLGNAQSERVWDILNIIQDRICEEASAFQAIGNITLVAGTELYDPPDGYLGEIALQPPSTTPIEHKKMDEVVEIKRVGTSLSNPTGDAVYFYEWANKIGFMNPSGAAPTSGLGVLTIYYWRKRKSDGSEDISSTIDPMVNQRWDNCLFLGAVALIGKNPLDLTLYEAEFQRQKGLEDSARDLSYRVPYMTEFD